MDIKRLKVEFAGMLGGLLQIDPSTGLPYSDTSIPPYPYLVGTTTRAYAEAPFSIPETDLPLWVVFTKGARYPVPPDLTIDRLAKEDRDFELRLYVCPAQDGIDGEAERKIEPYIEAGRNLIQTHPLIYDGNLSDIVPGIMRAYLVSDTGIVSLPFGVGASQTRWGGLVFTVRVEGRNINTYGNE